MNIFKTLDPSKRQNLLILFFSGLCFWTSLTTLLPTLPAYIEDVGGTTQQVGIVMGSFAIGLLLVRRTLGRMADAKGRKRVVMIGTFVVATAPLCYLGATSIPLLMAFRAFHGISVAAFTTGYSALVVDLSPPSQRGELIGYMSLVAPIGMGLGPALGGFLMIEGNYVPLFLASASVGILAFLFASQVKESFSKPIPTHSSSESSPNRFWQLLLSPRFRIPATVLLLVGLVFGTLVTFLPLYIRATEIELNAGLFYVATAIASFVVRVFIGRASDRYGRGLFITSSLACYGISMLLLTTANSPVVLLIAAIFEGAGAGIIIPMMIALMSDRSAATERGQVYAICIGGYDLGIAIAGPVLGSFADLTGYRGLFFLATLVSVVALTIFITLSSKNIPHSFRFALGQERDIYAIKY